MQTYTVCGLADEENGQLYVAEVYAGTPRPLSLRAVTRMPGGSYLARFTGHFEASSADEAEQVAVDVVSHFRDKDTEYWPVARSRRIDTVTIEGERL